MVNLHFSLLPRWRGAAPVERAILAGDPQHRRLPDGRRGGPRHRRRLRARRASTSARRDGRRAARPAGRRGHRAAGRRARATGWLRPGPSRASRPTPHKIEPDDLRLDWARPAVELHRVVRVGGAWTTFRGRRLKVWRSPRARSDARPAPVSPGQLVGDDGRVTPATGGLELLEVQPEGKRPPWPAADWSQTGCARPPPGERLGAVSAARPASRPPVALDALVRIERDGAYANLVLAPMLARSRLLERATGPSSPSWSTARPGMRRSCDWLVDRFLSRDPDAVDAIGAAPRRLPAGLPRHARRTPRSSATVALAPGRTRGLVNAVLRRVSRGAAVTGPTTPPG